MLFRIYLLICMIGTGAVFAQANKSANADRENFGVVQSKNDTQTSNSPSAKAVIQKIAVFEKSIASKVDDLEKLQAQAVEFNKNLKKELFIINENASGPAPGPQKFLISKHVEYSFEGGNKIKEIRVVSRHKSLTDDVNSIIKIVSFSPGNSESLKVTIDSLDSKANGILEVENYKDFAPEVKLQALKTIDRTLLNSIYRLDSYIQRSQATKNTKNQNQLEGL